MRPCLYRNRTLNSALKCITIPMMAATLVTLITPVSVGLSWAGIAGPSIEETDMNSIGIYVPVEGIGDFAVMVPRDWKHSVQEGPDGHAFTLTLFPASWRNFMIFLTPVGPKASLLAKADLDQFRAKVEETAQGMLAKAGERSAEIKELKKKEILGYYYTLTDKAPKPGEWKYMTLGMARFKELLVLFTILTDSQEAPEKDTALRILRRLGLMPF